MVKNRSYGLGFKYVVVFLGGMLVTLTTVYAFTIETSLVNAIQYIKQIIITSNGTPTGTVLLNVNNNATGGLYVKDRIGVGLSGSLMKLHMVDGTLGGTGNNTTANKGFAIGGSSTRGILNIGINAYSGFHSWIQSRNLDSATYYSLSLNPYGGNVGLGLTNPQVKLDVVGSALISSTDANLTSKTLRLGNKHYNNSEEPFYSYVASSISGENNVIIGGGTSVGNAATSILFYTAPNSITTNGSQRMKIDSAGNVGIGTNIPQTKLEVSGSLKLAEMGNGAPNLTGSIKFSGSNLWFYYQGWNKIDTDATAN